MGSLMRVSIQIKTSRIVLFKEMYLSPILLTCMIKGAMIVF